MQFRKTAIAAAVAGALGVSGAAYGGGFAIVTQSGSAVGNAFAGGAAAAEDASTIWYNPAGMVKLDGRNAALVGNGVRPSFKFENAGSTGAFAAPGTGEGGDGGSLAFVPQGYASMNIGPNWRIGLGINTPFGLKTNYDAGWRGQLTALKSEVTAYNINPSVAYNFGNGWSAGAGISVQRFSTELSNFAGPLGVARLEAHDTSWGFNLGALYELGKDTRIGMAYRSSIDYTLSGTATFSAGGGVFNSDAKADLRVPESATIGFFSAVTPQWDVMAGVTWTRWSRLDTITVVRTSASALGPAGSVISTLPFNWRNTVLLSAGANYKIPNTAWKVRMGIGFDPAAASDAERTARLPDEDRTLVTVGVSYAPSPNSRLDLSYAHEFVKDASIRNTVAGVPGMLIGNFNNKADVVSLQYSFQF